MPVVFRPYLEKLGGSTNATSYVGTAGDLFYDPETTTLRISDGTTPGGNTISSGTSGLSNVVEDTTPQLGGNLDTNGKSITFGSASISEAGGDLSIGYSNVKLSVTSDGMIGVPGSLYYKTTDADVLVAGSPSSPTAIDITRGVALLSDDLGSGNTWSLSDSFSGAVMQFVAIQSNDPTSLKIQGNFVQMEGVAVTEKTGAYWYPFVDADTANNTIATAIFYNGDKSSGGAYPIGWRISTGKVI